MSTSNTDQEKFAQACSSPYRRRWKVVLQVTVPLYLLLCIPYPYAVNPKVAEVTQVKTPKAVGAVVGYIDGYWDLAILLGGGIGSSVEVDYNKKEFRITPYQVIARFPLSPALNSGSLWIDSNGLDGEYAIKIRTTSGGYVEIGRTPVGSTDGFPDEP